MEEEHGACCEDEVIQEGVVRDISEMSLPGAVISTPDAASWVQTLRKELSDHGRQMKVDLRSELEQFLNNLRAHEARVGFRHGGHGTSSDMNLGRKAHSQEAPTMENPVGPGPAGRHQNLATPVRSMLPRKTLRSYRAQEVRDITTNTSPTNRERRERLDSNDSAVEKNVAAVRDAIKEDSAASLAFANVNPPGHSSGHSQAAGVDPPRVTPPELQAPYADQSVEVRKFVLPTVPSAAAIEAPGNACDRIMPSASGHTFESSKVATHDEQRRPGAVQRLVESSTFDYLSASLVILNSVTIGMQTDYLATHLLADPPTGYRVVDTLFCVAFTAELLLRLIAYRWSFFYASGWKWNLFDLLLVTLQLADETLSVMTGVFFSGGAEVDLNFSFMRVLRILRLIRIMRIIRVLRLIGELRAIVSSIMGSMKSLAWTLALLFLLVYVFGVYFTQLVLDHRLKLQEDLAAGRVSMEEDRELERYFGTLSLSILSLYQAITGGIDWSQLSNPLISQISVVLGLVIVFYIAFGVLALLNVVTGVFVEAALKSAKDDKDDYMLNHVRTMFEETEKGGGDIDLHAFKDMLDNEQMQEFFKAIDVDISEADSVFALLDADDSGTISLDEFLDGCLALRGPAKALDISILLHETRVFSHFIHQIVDAVSEIQGRLGIVNPVVTELPKVIATTMRANSANVEPDSPRSNLPGSIE